MSQEIQHLYRSDSRRVLATLGRLLGDFDLAEEALQDAFLAATEQWPRDGVPANPRAWLVSAGRFKAIDRLRRRARFDAVLGELAVRLADREPALAERDDGLLEEERLRLMFVCCHPALVPDAQAARGIARHRVSPAGASTLRGPAPPARQELDEQPPQRTASFLRRLGRTVDARVAYERALELTRQEPERGFIERRLRRPRLSRPVKESARRCDCCSVAAARACRRQCRGERCPVCGCSRVRGAAPQPRTGR